ncbi:MAG: DNA repair protein RecO C-terminal domain-containing protein [Candidatus Obscuribacter sp.]|nr:DNA repair protein RecO C-terminal domain-containing protein [Candidatus Obscuribacter sp.]
MAESQKDPAVQCLEFEMAVLETVGLSPELTYCVGCRHPATEQTISAFNYELGGLVCQSCFHRMRQDAYGHTASAISQEDRAMVRENAMEGQKASIYVTPLVWKRLVIARSESEKFPNMDELDGDNRFTREDAGSRKSLTAARRLMQGYIEYKSGRRLKSLSVLESLPEDQF